MAGKTPLYVTIRGRDGIIFEGNATSVTSYNAKGPFDVLSHHANFISLVQKKISIIKPDNTLIETDLDNGVMRVYKNVVDIFLGVTSY